MNKLPYSSTPLNILIIEDNPGDFFLLQEYIEEMFLHTKIVHVESYKEAEKVLTEQNVFFDTILLDGTLPDKQALGLVSDILSLANQTPVIILTGYESLDFSIHSLSLGVSEYLLKDEINAYSLHKSILFSIERKKYFLQINESEKQYSELFQLTPIPMWVYDLSTLKILTVNSAATKYYGYSELEFLNLSILDLFPDIEIKNKIKQQGKQSQDFNQIVRQELKNGKIIQVNIEQSYLTIENRSCCIMLSNDLTELIDTQDSLKSAYKNILKIEEKEKKKFATELHDGLQQNIVAAKLIFAFITEQSPQLAKEPRAILLDKTLQSTIVECSQLIREIRPKKIIENSFSAELEILIEKVKATGNLEVNLSKNIEIDLAFDVFDLMHIYRILQELFNNSLKHASADQINLSLTSNSIEKNSFNLIYKDNGRGIPKEILNAKSTFLSLKRRVNVLSSSMEVESSLNEGTIFRICIPFGQNFKHR